jgi:hypothetical protein
MKALAPLLLDRRLSVSVRTRKGRETLPEPGVLRVLPASLIEPALSLLWGGETSGPDARDQELGLSPAVWASDWNRWLYQADTPRAFRGSPDYDRPWVLVGPSISESVESLRARAGIPDAQLHFLSASWQAPDDSVTWRPTTSAVRFLLARVDAVVASRAALAFDAVRSGLPVVVAGSVAAGTRQAWAVAACNVVPAAVQHAPRLWARVADRLAGAERVNDWGTRAWVLQSRDALRSPSALTRWSRKLEKWRRDPVAFWRDSRLLRWMG